MNRFEKIAKKVVADYGDITTYVNIFDIFDTNFRTKELGTVRQDLLPDEIEMMKEFVRETANELQRMLNHDIIAELKKDGKLTRWMKAKGIRFNSRYE
jgi:transcription-repair coupling factor (superfamily II helicase)